jgi:transcription-repair coupling factor (superfamily II helicase)
MRLDEIIRHVDHVAALPRLLHHLQNDCGHIRLDGLQGVAKSLVVAALARAHGGPTLVVTLQHDQAERICDDLRQFGTDPDGVLSLPALERDPLLRSAVDYAGLSERMAALAALGSGREITVVGTLEGIAQRVGDPRGVLDARIAIEAGATADLAELARRLVAIGYSHTMTVTVPGQFARRGGIFDVYPVGANLPVRLELFGDEIESMRVFDPATQRSTGAIEGVSILPVYPVVLTKELVERAEPLIRLAWNTRRAALARAGASASSETVQSLDDHVEEDLAALKALDYPDSLPEYMPFLVPEPICALDYLMFGAKRPLLILDDPAQMETRWLRLKEDRQRTLERHAEQGRCLMPEEADLPDTGDVTLDRLAAMPCAVQLSSLGAAWDRRRSLRSARDDVVVQMHSAPMETFRSRLDFLKDEVTRWLEHGALCVAVTDQPQRTREVLAELSIPIAEDVGRTEAPPPLHSPAEGAGREGGDGPGRPPAGLIIVEGRVRQGVKFDDALLYLITDHELYGSARAAMPSKRAAGGVPISTLLDLRENDYVVHVAYGIGVYRGLVKRVVDGAEKDYLLIQYAGPDRLYVPADQIDRVQRYVGTEGARPTVNRIIGSDWQRTTRKVKEQARAMARELVELYAAREQAERPIYGDDSPWQAEMEEAFPYEETPGQLRAIADVKADLNTPRPADRLICGDVGFGKTEVAIRAAFKVVESGKQVAVLCPTTVLAAQHHTTFTERLAAYPIRVELLSRFRSRAEQKATVTNLRTGATDIVIGTHRLLSRDVEFHRLGMLVIDEEQRFGVAQKERLKQLRKSVDVLTLTATPIPRTLSMALSGLRDLSVIEDPPGGRLPIVTHVREYDDDLVRDAILRELERGGQVYYVHNRVETIENVAMRVQRLVPEARIRIGHGQMSEDELERIMHGFYLQEYDVLVCTTIIENGLDIPNVNTIIVENADHMGLAQLYQLRGRVGRSSRQAYAYLLVRRGRLLTEDAEQRLTAIREFTALGSGYHIAMRDLEIRGAGNLLGAEQSGAMSAVGFDMYCRLLAQAVAETRGIEYTDETLPPADLPLTAHIPVEYIPNEAERIYFYKRMSGVTCLSDITQLQEELEDRYGDPPKPVWNALEVLRIRLLAKQAGISAVRHENGCVTLRFAPGVRLTPRALNLLTHMFKGTRFTADSVILRLASPRVVPEVEEMLKVLANALQDGSGRPAGRPAQGG